MNKELKAKWVEALRDGEYEQGLGRLRYVDEENGGHSKNGLQAQEVPSVIMKTFCHPERWRVCRRKNRSRYLS